MNDSIKNNTERADQEEAVRRKDRQTVYGDFYRRRETRDQWEKKMHPIPSLIINIFMLFATFVLSFWLPVFGLAAWLIYRDVRQGHGHYALAGFVIGTVLWTLNVFFNFLHSFLIYN